MTKNNLRPINKPRNKCKSEIRNQKKNQERDKLNELESILEQLYMFTNMVQGDGVTISRLLRII